LALPVGVKDSSRDLLPQGGGRFYVHDVHVDVAACDTAAEDEEEEEEEGERGGPHRSPRNTARICCRMDATR
jgi:hypothetical protein